MGGSESKKEQSLDTSIVQGDPEGCDWDQIFPMLFEKNPEANAIFGQSVANWTRLSARPLKTYGQSIPARSLGLLCRPGRGNPQGRGHPESNQDDLFFWSSGADVANDQMMDRPWMAGVFDGHGPVGQRFSAMARNWMPLLILRDPNFPRDVPQAIENAYEKMSALAGKAAQSAGMDEKLSGTTCVLVVHANGILYVGWLGDSKAVASFFPSPDEPLTLATMLVESLTRDHKPEIAFEKSMVESAGGKVVENRVWFLHQLPKKKSKKKSKKKPQEMSGLGVSRSLGDDLAHKQGVSDRPDLKMLPLTSTYGNGAIVLLASDGVFDYIDPQSAVQIVSNELLGHLGNPDANKELCRMSSKQNAVQLAAEALANEVERRSLEDDPDYMDDITVLVILVPLYTSRQTSGMETYKLREESSNSEKAPPAISLGGSSGSSGSGGYSAQTEQAPAKKLPAPPQLQSLGDQSSPGDDVIDEQTTTPALALPSMPSTSFDLYNGFWKTPVGQPVCQIDNGVLKWTYQESGHVMQDESAEEVLVFLNEKGELMLTLEGHTEMLIFINASSSSLLLLSLS